MTEPRPPENPSPENNGDLWKKSSLGLAGVLLGIMPWLVGVTRDLPNRTEVMQMIEKRSPYIEDRSRIMDWIEHSKKEGDSVGSRLDRLHESVIRLDEGMRQLATTLNDLKETLKGKP